MREATLSVCKAALAADPEVTPIQRKHYLAFLRNGKETHTKNLPPVEAKPRILRPAVVAARLGRTIRHVHALAAEGLLVKVKLRGRERAAGITEQSLEKLIAENAFSPRHE